MFRAHASNNNHQGELVPYPKTIFKGKRQGREWEAHIHIQLRIKPGTLRLWHTSVIRWIPSVFYAPDHQSVVSVYSMCLSLTPRFSASRRQILWIGAALTSHCVTQPCSPCSHISLIRQEVSWYLTRSLVWCCEPAFIIVKASAACRTLPNYSCPQTSLHFIVTKWSLIVIIRRNTT